MYKSQQPFRSLYEALLAHEGEDAFADVLAPWLEKNGDERRFLDGFALRRPGEAAWPTATDEELCRLYAMSRVNDVLLLRQAPPSANAGTWAGPALSLDHYVRFMTGLGLQVARPRPSFAPFFHEVVAATSSPANAPIRIETEHWPALFLGDMLFCRAGCSIAAPSARIDPDLGTTSILHWAFRRRNRRTMDLSVGWGSNSQWATSFRRDYRIAGMLHFNVDGKLDARVKDTGRRPNEAREDLTPDERVELLTHRAFVRTKKPDDDLWPWDDRLSLEDA